MKKVAIVGAGISGLYLANELNKNTEIDYKIFEKKDYLNLNEGYGIQLSVNSCLLYTSPSPRDTALSRMPSSA